MSATQQMGVFQQPAKLIRRCIERVHKKKDTTMPENNRLFLKKWTSVSRSRWWRFFVCGFRWNKTT
jgi:hypothetical protein